MLTLVSNRLKVCCRRAAAIWSAVQRQIHLGRERLAKIAFHFPKLYLVQRTCGPDTRFFSRISSHPRVGCYLYDAVTRSVRPGTRRSVTGY